MLTFGYLVLALHFILLLILSLFGLHRLSMALRWLRYRHNTPEAPSKPSVWPQVTVQIPLYNERLVAERAIHAAVQLDYPRDKLQIQVVDDSTDETRELVAQLVNGYADQGISIEHVRRDNRSGFKAGALKAAMAQATGEFIAIFDADFVPEPSTLRDNLPYFADDGLAMVQFRWEHLNRYSSTLTECQAMMLDAHFALEQQVRYASGALFNFNGTAGIWRTTAILDAGHWSADTLTEDLDLSYRAQLKGWRMLYRNASAAPGELPADMNAFKSQQHRWAKGGIQVMKKLLGRVWRSPLPLKHKLESTFHLSNNLAYFVMLLDTTLLLVPSLIVRDQLGLPFLVWVDVPLLLLASGSHLVYFYTGQVALGRSRVRALVLLPRLLLVGIQLAFNNARAAAEALAGHASEFVRTPKAGASGDRSSADSAAPNDAVGAKLYRAIAPRGGWFEVLLGSIYLYVFAWGIAQERWFMLPFLLLLALGFFSTAIGTLRDQLRLRAG